jgi:hypothetical protein
VFIVTLLVASQVTGIKKGGRAGARSPVSCLGLFEAVALANRNAAAPPNLDGSDLLLIDRAPNGLARHTG